MDINKDKIVYEALMKVLHNGQYAHIAEAFRENTEELQKLLPAFTSRQQDVVQCYAHSLADMYLATLAVSMEALAPKGPSAQNFQAL